jgi:1-hydroxycarotenoid 3,4-desaturase
LLGRSPRIAVIGAGIAGLSAALRLRVHGCEVTVFERAASVGGKMRQLGVPGSPIDAGPTVLTLRAVLDELFSEAGASLEDHLQLRALTTLARHAWSSGERLDLHADPQQSAAAIGEFAGSAESRGYLRFCADARRVFETLDRRFLRSARPSLAALISDAGWRGVPDLWRLRPFTSLWRVLGDYFRDPRLRQLFARYATYCGCSPFRAPATLMLIAHVEQAGVWQVLGGMHRVAVALAELLCRRGGAVRCDTSVARIEVRTRQAHAIELADGERVPIDALIVTCDAAALGAGLLGAEAARAAAQVPRTQRSLSALTWTAAIPTQGFELLHHNVFFSRDYRAEFGALEQAQSMPCMPTVYVCAQDRSAAHAPAAGERERLLCLINAPPIGDHVDYTPEDIELCRSQMMRQLAHCGLQLLGGAEQFQATTPSDFNRLFPGSGGALYGRATHGWRASFQRPGARTPVRRLYLAGGSTHPGPGLPMAARSGSIAAQCLLQDFGLMPQ